MLFDSKKWDHTPKYLTAKQLHVSEDVRESFIAVHQAMLRGEIPEEQFNMGDVGEPVWWDKTCGTPGCLQGWAQAYAINKWGSYSDQVLDIEDRSSWSSLNYLCYPSEYDAITCHDTHKACQALGNWLITGHARWREVLRKKKVLV